MAVYVYPAVFAEDTEGGFSVEFPDLEDCYTCGDDIADAMKMAEDVLALVLVRYEDEKRPIPEPSSVKALHTDENSFVTMIRCDTVRYRRMMNHRAVKKTLSIPSWLNEAASAAGLNFSQILQDGLKEKLGF